MRSMIAKAFSGNSTVFVQNAAVIGGRGTPEGGVSPPDELELKARMLAFPESNDPEKGCDG